MLKIRLTRRGKKRQPSYRVVVADAEAPRDGRFVESIGYYDPLVDPVDYKIQEDRALYWLSVGAQPTDAVRGLLTRQGTYERLIRVHQGEGIDVLAAEYYGVPVVTEVVEEAAEVEAVVESEEVEEKVGFLAAVKEAVSDVVEDVVDLFDGDDDEGEVSADTDTDTESDADAATDEETATE